MRKYVFVTTEGIETAELAQHNGYYSPAESAATASILGCIAVDVSKCKTNEDYDAAIKKAAA